MNRSSFLAITMLVCAAIGAWVVAENRMFGFVVGGVGGLVLGVAILSYRTGADENPDIFFKD